MRPPKTRRELRRRERKKHKPKNPGVSLGDYIEDDLQVGGIVRSIKVKKGYCLIKVVYYEGKYGRKIPSIWRRYPYAISFRDITKIKKR